MGKRELPSGMACLLCIGLLVSMAKHCAASSVLSSTTAAPTITVPSPASRPQIQHNLDPFHSTKRKVPNGPDPIHNRRAGKSARPPGRV